MQLPLSRKRKSPQYLVEYKSILNRLYRSKGYDDIDESCITAQIMAQTVSRIGYEMTTGKLMDTSAFSRIPYNCLTIPLQRRDIVWVLSTFKLMHTRTKRERRPVLKKKNGLFSSKCIKNTEISSTIDTCPNAIWKCLNDFNFSQIQSMETYLCKECGELNIEPPYLFWLSRSTHNLCGMDCLLSEKQHSPCLTFQYVFTIAQTPCVWRKERILVHTCKTNYAHQRAMINLFHRINRSAPS